MPTAPARVTQAAIRRAIRAAKAEGMTVEVQPSGAILVVPLPKTSRPVYADLEEPDL